MAQITERDLKAALPDVTSTMALSGLKAGVTVFRDAWGIPHIQAGGQHDLFFAQGFVTAQDRLWHMDYDRHRALGRWAEWVGPGAIRQDRLMRAAGMGRTAKRDYAACSDASRERVDAYAAGVNAFIGTTKALPVEYRVLGARPEPWEGWHCTAVYKMRNTLLGTFEPKLFRTLLAREGGVEGLRRVLRGYPRGHLVTVPPGARWDGALLDGLEELSRAAEESNWTSEVDAGSNAWSVSGRRTASGKPLVGGDSHRALDVPSVYYQVHLSCPAFQVIGSSVPGMPGALHFCHNDHVAWGMTYGSADTQDLFLERFRETPGGREYAFKGGWRKAEVLTERIDVCGAAPVTMEVTITHHGPVVAGSPSRGAGVAISDPGLLEGTAWVDAAFLAMRSRSVPELHAAFANWTDRVNNYAVADVHGNFGYLHEGKIPIRDAPNGWGVVPGWTGTHEWRGTIPQEELPRAINPEAGYAVTCNQRVAGSDYPYYVGLVFTPEFRAARVRERILALGEGKATAEDMTGIHAERASIPARVLVETLKGEPSVAVALTAALDALRTWDGRMDRDSVGAALYAATRVKLVEAVGRRVFGKNSARVLSDEAGADAHARLLALEITLGIERDDRSLLSAGETWREAILSALEAACEELKGPLGPDVTTWHWGRLHRTAPKHPLSAVFPDSAALLDPPGFAVHGDGDTPLQGGFATHSRYRVTSLSVNRYVHDPSDWRKSLWIVPLGASGHPGSPHYADQAPLHADVAFIPQLWDWDEIAAKAETEQALVPSALHRPERGNRGAEERGCTPC